MLLIFHSLLCWVLLHGQTRAESKLDMFEREDRMGLRSTIKT